MRTIICLDSSSLEHTYITWTTPPHDDNYDDNDDDDDDDCFYIALFSVLVQTHCARMWLILHEWQAFYSAFLNIHRSGVLTAVAWPVPHETASISAQVPCTPYNHAPCHFMLSHVRKVCVCLAVTCHMHFWQNDLDLLRATAVTRGWNRYRNKPDTSERKPPPRWETQLAVCLTRKTTLLKYWGGGILLEEKKMNTSNTHKPFSKRVLDTAPAAGLSVSVYTTRSPCCFTAATQMHVTIQ